jgi:DNA polymerase IV (DinB-like DNA polymerase)
MHQFALGIDKREVKEKIEAKSIGRERTFDKDTANLEKINKTLIALAHRVQEKIVKKGYLFKTITLKVRLKDFTTYTRSRTLEHYTNNLETLIKIAQGLLNEFVGNKIRLIGVRVSGIKLCQKQKSLAEF